MSRPLLRDGLDPRIKLHHSRIGAVMVHTFAIVIGVMDGGVGSDEDNVPKSGQDWMDFHSSSAGLVWGHRRG